MGWVLATRRRLGRPSPHQQADRPRAHPTPQIAFHHTTCMARSYPVLDPVSQAYPKVQGRSPTCYSPVRHSSISEETFPFDLHVLSTPPAFVLNQDQTLQQKPPQTAGESEPEKSDLTKRHQKTGIKKQPHPTHGKCKRHGQSPAALCRLLAVRTTKDPTEVEFPSGTSSRSTTRSS